MILIFYIAKIRTSRVVITPHFRIVRILKGENFMNFNTLLATPQWAITLSNALKNVINPILILVATAGIIYAIVVGIKFVKADDKGQREEAKAKLISVIIGIAVTAALIALFYWLTWALQNGLFGEITSFISTDNLTTA